MRYHLWHPERGEKEGRWELGREGAGKRGSKEGRGGREGVRGGERERETE